jgi:hypothetical protein
MVGVGAHFVVSHCAQGGDAGVAPATVSAVDPTNGNVTDLLSDVTSLLSTDKNGTQVAMLDSQSRLVVVPITGGSPTVIDSMVADGQLLSTGAAAVYVTTGNDLKRSAITSPSPMKLTGNATGLNALSDDDGYVIFHQNIDSNTMLSDLFLASTSTAGTPVTLNSASDGAIYGDAFTVDHTRALYFTGVDGTNLVGALKSQPVAGGTEVTLGNNVWLAFGTSGTKVAYNDNFTKIKNGGRADLQVGDSAGGTPTMIATSAETDFFLSHAKDKLIFSYQATTGKEGIYVTPVP